MDSKQPDYSATSRQKKKAQFSAPGETNHKKTLAIIGFLVTIGLVGYFSGRGFTSQPPATAVTVAPSSTAAKPDPGAPPPAAATPETEPAPATAGAKPAGETAPPSGDILIPTADVSSGHAKFFNYTASDKTKLRFFVVKSSDGIYRTALDACDVCYREKKGYQQEGDDMVCQNCGRRFPSKLVNDVTGGCNPVAVTRTVVGSNLLIKAAELESLKAYF